MRRLQCRYRPAACISQPFGSSSLRSITTLPTRGAFPLAEYENASSAATKALLSQSTAVLTTAVPQQLLDRLQELHSDVQDVISPEDPPSKFGRYLMWSERREDATMYKRVDSSKKEQVVLDMARFNKEMKFKHSFLGSMALSNDSYQRFVAFTVDSEGRDSFTCFVRDIFRGVTLRDRINRVGTMAWAPDQKDAPSAIFYTVLDSTLRSSKLFLHILGSPLSQDSLLLHVEDPGASIYVSSSKDRSAVVVQVLGVHFSRLFLADIVQLQAMQQMQQQQQAGAAEAADTALPSDSTESTSPPVQAPSWVGRLAEASLPPDATKSHITAAGNKVYMACRTAHGPGGSIHVADLPEGGLHAFLQQATAPSAGSLSSSTSSLSSFSSSSSPSSSAAAGSSMTTSSAFSAVSAQREEAALSFYASAHGLAKTTATTGNRSSGGSGSRPSGLSAGMEKFGSSFSSPSVFSTAATGSSEFSSGVSSAGSSAPVLPAFQSATASPAFPFSPVGADGGAEAAATAGSSAALPSPSVTAAASHAAGDLVFPAPVALPLSWRELVPARTEVTVHDFEVFSQFLLLYETKGIDPVLRKLVLKSSDTPAAAAAGAVTGAAGGAGDAAAPSTAPIHSLQLSEDIPLPSDAADVIGGLNADPSAERVSYSVTYPHKPSEYFLYEKSTGPVLVDSACLPDSPLLPVTFSTDFQSYRIHAPSLDGTRIPITVVHRSDLGIDVKEVQHRAELACSRVQSWVDMARDSSDAKGLKGGAPASIAGKQPGVRLDPLSEYRKTYTAKFQSLCRDDAAGGGSLFDWRLERFPGLPGHAEQVQKAQQAAEKSWQEGKTLPWDGNVKGKGPGGGGWLGKLKASLMSAGGSGGSSSSSSKVPFLTHRQQTEQREKAAGGSLGAEAWRYNNPSLLQAYGAYGERTVTDFDPSEVPLLSRGWVYAFAHVRGGGDMNTASWHAAGSRFKKANSFLDTVAAAHMLVASGLSRSRYMAGAFQSAGGLIGGHLATHYPGLLQTVLLHSPFLDVERAMTDPSLPLTTVEFAEWGHPTQEPAIRDYWAHYSPVAAAARLAEGNKAGSGFASSSPLLLPHVFSLVSSKDARVPAYHSWKYVAALQQAVKSSGGAAAAWQPLLACLSSDGANHFGAGTMEDRASHAAMEDAFLLQSMGLSYPAGQQQQ